MLLDAKSNKSYPGLMIFSLNGPKIAIRIVDRNKLMKTPAVKTKKR
jgi:hypothetical protein